MAAVSMGERERSWAYFTAWVVFAIPVSPLARWQKAAIFATLVSGVQGIFERFVDGEEPAKLADDANELGERQQGRNLDEGEFGRRDALFRRY